MGLKELSSQQLCKLGETALALELMNRGYDVINLNESLQNYMNADLLCMSGKTGEGIKIQVKTGTTKNIRCGLIAEPTTGVIQNLDDKIICPWVFVHIAECTTDDGKADFKFDFYVLLPDETKELLRTAHHWYATQWDRQLTKNIQVGVDVPWLKASISKASKHHPEYKSSLGCSAQDRWDKIAL